jgi:hypothetical protein
VRAGVVVVYSDSVTDDTTDDDNDNYNDDNSSSSKLSEGEVAAVVICTLVGVGAISASVYYYLIIRPKTLSTPLLAPQNAYGDKL